MLPNTSHEFHYTLLFDRIYLDGYILVRLPKDIPTYMCQF